jgi:tetratricopeptide (TPR) repeat protein
LQVQGDVALAIAEKVSSNLSQEEKDRLAESDDVDPAAYELYRQGLHQYDNYTSDGFVASESLMRGALKIDPGYNEAAGLLVSIPWMQSIWGGSAVTPEEAVNQSRAILQQYEPNLRSRERMKLSRAWLSYYGERNWIDSERGFREFIEEMPHHPSGATSYASYLVHVEGRTQEALRLVNLAIEEEPDRLNFLHNRAVCHLIAGDYAACLKDRDDILRAHPDHWHSIIESSACQAALGSFEDAVKRARDAVKVSKEHPVCLANLSKILALSGETDEALKLYGQLKKKREEIYFDEGWLAEAAYALGLKEEAFELLETAAAGKGRWSMLALRGAFTIGLMGDEPRYWELVDQLNFPPLPYSHLYYEKEQQMRFGKGEDDMGLGLAVRPPIRQSVESSNSNT